MDKIISTAKQFILSPKSEWEVVKSDKDTAHQHVMKYVLPLALISAVAIFIGVGLIGYRVLGYRIQSVSGGLAQAIMSLASILIGVYLSGFVIHKLAPTFDTTVKQDNPFYSASGRSTRQEPRRPGPYLPSYAPRWARSVIGCAPVSR